MPIVEGLILKGLIGLGKIIATKGLAVKVGVIATKAIATYGIGATIGTACTVGLVAGGIFWTRDRINNLERGIKALENGDNWEAVKNFGQLAINSNLDVVDLPDAVHDCLIKSKFTYEHADVISDAVRKLESDIVDYVKSK